MCFLQFELGEKVLYVKKNMVLMMKKFMVIDSKVDVIGQLIMMYLEMKYVKWEGLIDEKFFVSIYFEEVLFIYIIMIN